MKTLQDFIRENLPRRRVRPERRMDEHGLFTGLYDRNGRKIKLGDRLSFDPVEWGDHCEFVIEFRNGQLIHPGTIDDLSQHCDVIE